MHANHTSSSCAQLAMIGRAPGPGEVGGVNPHSSTTDVLDCAIRGIRQDTNRKHGIRNQKCISRGEVTCIPVCRGPNTFEYMYMNLEDTEPTWESSSDASTWLGGSNRLGRCKATAALLQKDTAQTLGATLFFTTEASLGNDKKYWHLTRMAEKKRCVGWSNSSGGSTLLGCMKT